ncbi:MAG: hypothetical protein QM772_11920 [Ottowia sp.]|uniref:hypothetical protein n=1 Tax=Ottowia sp. TaxID=1898956 RepID=UPI0039E4544D
MHYDITDSPALPAADSSLLFFQGSTACGAVGLALAREAGAEGPVTGAEQVLRLAQAEPLLRAVEQWLRSPWDPAPCAARALPGYRAVVRDPAVAPPGTTLHLPLAALLAPPPPVLRAPALAWAGHAAEALLGPVPAEALARLEPQALVWLPAAFGAEWAVSLRDPEGRLPPCPARLDLAAQRLVVTAGAPPAIGAPDTAAAEPQAVLAQRVQVPLDHWLGWGRAEVPFHWPVPQPWAAELRQGGAARARGALMRLGQGCGLWLEAV